MKTLTLNGVRFAVSNDGLVSSSNFEKLGNIDDCQELADLIWHIFDTLHAM